MRLLAQFVGLLLDCHPPVCADRRHLTRARDDRKMIGPPPGEQMAGRLMESAVLSGFN
jgi:hypothetical protein